MAPDRVANALDNLISHIVPRDPDEDDESAQMRHDARFDQAMAVLQRYLLSLKLDFQGCLPGLC